ncbi:4Fe-4S binding protein [Candidatus Oscillochloris fontis]|uniref:4Fe-4S binding protein n=1 Tax=Candidatus Oscillochloris fontis TaxID=2496868 RepID=UPI00101BEDCD|nr:4Fe-4S binding protein [Candidatus Oscillochloris fontis]
MQTPTHSHQTSTRLRMLQSLRHLVQLAVVGFIIVVATQHLVLGDASASPEAFCPFGGLETLYSYLTGGSTIAHTHLSNLAIFLAVVITSVIARGAFCGWICPFGTIQEWIQSVSRWLQRRIRPFGRAMHSLNQHLNPRTKRDAYTGPTLGQRIDKALSYGRYVVLAWIIGATIAYGSMVFRDYDPWSALLSIAELQVTVGTYILIASLVASFFVDRAWCRYACPLGATISLLGRFSPFRIEISKSACNQCGLCTQHCPMGIDVAHAGVVTDMRCIGCMKCVSDCSRTEAIDMRLAVPGTPSVVTPKQ